MLGLSGLAQSALAALPVRTVPAAVPFFRNLSWHQPYGQCGVRVTAAQGGVIRTGTKAYFPVACDCNVVGWMLLADKVGSLVVDVARCLPADVPPTLSDTITFNHKPTLTNAQCALDRSLLDWTTALHRYDVLGIEVLSAAIVTSFTLALLIDRA